MTTIKNYLYIGLGIFLLIVFGYIYYLKTNLDNTKAKLTLANQTIDSLNTYIEKTNQQLKVI